MLTLELIYPCLSLISFQYICMLKQYPSSVLRIGPSFTPLGVFVQAHGPVADPLSWSSILRPELLAIKMI
jgi:hypothetical protein